MQMVLLSFEQDSAKRSTMDRPTSKCTQDKVDDNKLKILFFPMGAVYPVNGSRQYLVGHTAQGNPSVVRYLFHYFLRSGGIIQNYRLT